MVGTTQAQQWSGGGGSSSIVGTVSGTLLDSVSQEPVQFATIVLLDAKTEKQVNGIVTEMDGTFKIQNVKTGTYDVQLSFMGYRPKTIKGIELTPKSPDYDMGILTLTSETYDIEALEVTGEAATFENKIDKLVYNPEKDVTVAGGDASEVLARVPLLAVDADGNVSIRGSSNIQILVNGRPSTLFQSNPGDALRTIPAEMIKSVEVITVPTARFDGEGTGGIINLIMKKQSVQGFTGSVNASAGNRSNSGSLNMNMVRGRFGLNLNAGGWASWPRPASSTFLRVDTLASQELRVLDQESEGAGYFYGPRVTLGAFYDFNAYNSINTNVTYRGFGRVSEDETVAMLTDPSRDLLWDYMRTNESRSLRGGFDWTSDYRRTFDREGQEFIAAFQISGNNSNTTNTIFQQGNVESLYQNEENENDGLNLETTFQVDYVHPFNDNLKLETGAKGILRTIGSDFEYRNFNRDTEEFEVDFSRTDNFIYNQDVFAGYASFNIQLNEKYGMIAGARYEYTAISGDFDANETTFSNDYSNFLPSVIFSRTINDFSAVRLSYTKRIQRPSLFYINPFVQNQDPLNVSQGNPEILPETTDAYELSYNTYIKGVVLNASAFFRQTNDVIEPFIEIRENGLSVETFRNIGLNRTYGMNFFSSATLFKKLTVRGGANVYNYQSEGTFAGRQLSNSGIVWGGNINLSLRLPKDWQVEASGFYRSPQQSLQGTRASYRRIQFGARKQLWDDRGGIGIVIAQPFARDLQFPNELQGVGFYQRSNRAFASRNIGISFNYRFGQLDFKERRRRGSVIDNSDQKSGGDSGNY
jgi:outer membrane receptor protein involved in Fe transport